MRIGREFNLPNYLDRDSDNKDWAQARPTENPFNIEEILDSLHKVPVLLNFLMSYFMNIRNKLFGPR